MIRCYRDERGVQVSAQDLPQIVSMYLIHDVQSSIEACDEILESVQAVREGHKPSWTGFGNGFFIEFRDSLVFLSDSDHVDEFDLTADELQGRNEQSGHQDHILSAWLPIDVFEQCIREWRGFLWQDFRERFLAMRADGKSIEEIGKHYGYFPEMVQGIIDHRV